MSRGEQAIVALFDPWFLVFLAWILVLTGLFMGLLILVAPFMMHISERWDGWVRARLEKPKSVNVGPFVDEASDQHGCPMCDSHNLVLLANAPPHLCIWKCVSCGNSWTTKVAPE